MKKYILTGLLVSLLTACSTPKIKDHVETIGDIGDVKIKDLRSMKVNNLLMAQGGFYNDGDKVVQGYYRCKFLDANNFQVGDDQTWQLATIYPNQTQNFKCQATNLESVNFKIEFSNNASNVTVYR